MKKSRWKTVLAMISLALVAGVCLYATAYRASGCLPLSEDAALLAGRLRFINGSFSAPTESDKKAPTEVSEKHKVKKPLADTPTQSSESAERPQNYNHTGASYPVVETSVTNGTETYDNINIRNTTDFPLDPEALLSAKLPFDIKDNHSVQVLIYHTHTCESYLPEDTGEYYEDFYPRSTDPDQGVMSVGEKLVDTLRGKGIGAVHDSTLHDYPSYEGSYARSWDTISNYAEKYPDIKITIDLHRDSMTAQDGTKYKPTFTYNGQKAAQIMIMTGYDTSGDFPFWDENLIFAMQLQKKCEDMYPGMTRPLNFGEYVYNMNFNNGSLLIEVGTDANTPEEACRTGEYLANALSSLLQNK